MNAIDVVYVRGSARPLIASPVSMEIVTAKGTNNLSPTIGWSLPPAAGYSARISPASSSTLQRRQARRCDCAGPASDGWRISLQGRGAIRSSWPAAIHRHGGGDGRSARLRAILGKEPRRASHRRTRQRRSHPNGRGPPPVIEEALRKLGVVPASAPASRRSTSPASRFQRRTIESGADLGGAACLMLTAQIPDERDNVGRLLVDRDLRVPCRRRVCHGMPPGQRVTESATTR